MAGWTSRYWDGNAVKHFVDRTLSNPNRGFVLGFLIILAVGTLSVSNLYVFVANEHRVAHSLDVVARLAKTLSLIKDAETGQWGYLATGEEEYLEPYNAATTPDGIHSQIQILRYFIADNPNQRKRLDAIEALIAARLIFVQETIELRQKQGFHTARQVILAYDKGKTIMVAVRSLIGAMEDEGNRLRSRWATAAAASARKAIRVVIIGTLLSIALLTFPFLLIKRELAQRRRAEQTAGQISDELENRVQQRTTELAQANRAPRPEVAGFPARPRRSGGHCG